MRYAVERLRELGQGWNRQYSSALLAEAEADAGRADIALAKLDEILTETSSTEQRMFDAELHRIRGEILLKRDPANTRAAEEAYLSAIAIAQQQKAKSFELRAAFPWRRFINRVGRLAEAHAVLAPAIVSFSPTPEFPEIAEAQAFLTALAATDEVMRIVDQRQRRLKLQTSYGHALAMFRGFSSDETKAAFTKAEQMLAGINDPTERYLTYYGLWLPSASRGDLASARATAETFFHDAASANRMTETAIAHALLGFTCWIQGDFDSALTHLHDAIRICDPRRDREAALRFNALDAGAWASLYLAIALWLRGEVERADETIKDARQRAIECAHAPVLAQHYDFEGMFEALRGDAEAVRRAAELCIEVGQEHGIAVFLSEGIGYLGWARAKLGEREAGIAQLNECISAHVEQGNRAFIPFFQGLLAEIERQEGDPQAGLSRID